MVSKEDPFSDEMISGGKEIRINSANIPLKWSSNKHEEQKQALAIPVELDIASKSVSSQEEEEKEEEKEE